MAPSPAQPLSGKGVQRIPPSLITDSTTESTGSVSGSIGPVQDTTHHTKNQRERRKERKVRNILNLHDIFDYKEPYFPKMINLTFPGIDISSELNIIRTEADLIKQIGKPERIVKANKSTLLIETKSKEQTEKLIQIKHIAGKEIITKIHPTLNTVKGVIKSRSFGACTEEEIVNHLKDQGVISCYRHKIHRNGELINTDTYFINFQLMKLPRILKITDWHHELVEEYKERPRQCNHCYRYSHVAKFCRHELPTCAKCGEQGHRASVCENDLCCLHCKNQHYANDRECEKYKIECEILSTQMKEKTSRMDAMQKVNSLRPDGGRLYSTVTRTPIDSNNNINNNEETVNNVIPFQNNSYQPKAQNNKTPGEGNKKQEENPEDGITRDSLARRSKNEKQEETRKVAEEIIRKKKYELNNGKEKPATKEKEMRNNTLSDPNEILSIPMETDIVNDKKRSKPDDNEETSISPKSKQANRGKNYRSTSKENTIWKEKTENDKSQSLQSLTQYESDESISSYSKVRDMPYGKLNIKSVPSSSKNKDTPTAKYKTKESESTEHTQQRSTNKISVINSRASNYKHK